MPVTLTAKGSRSGVYWKEESSFGVAPSGNYNNIALNSETLDETIATITGQDIRPTRTRGDVRGGNKATGGNIVCDFDPDANLTLLRHAIAAGNAASGSAITPTALASAMTVNRGDIISANTTRIYIALQGGTLNASVSNTSLTGTVVGGIETLPDNATGTVRFMYIGPSSTTYYSHALTGGAAWPTVGITFEKQLIGAANPTYINFVGCRINTLDLTITQDGVAKLTYGILGIDSNKLGSSGIGTAVFPSTELSIGFDAAISINQPGGVNTGTTWNRFKEFSMQMTNNAVEDAYVISGRTRIDIPEGERQYSGRVTMYFVDSTEYDLFKNETTVPLHVSLATKGKYLVFDWPEVKLTESGTPKISGSGAVMAEFTWTAFQSSGAYDCRITAKNATQTLPV